MRPDRQRLDKWLWFARFAKTRGLAIRLVSQGHVRINGARAEAASRALAVGDIVTVAAAHATRTVRVLDLGERRGPAQEASRLYADLTDQGCSPAPAADPTEALSLRQTPTR